MAVTLSPKQPREVLGKERRARLTGEPASRFHGTLTRQLCGIFECVDPNRESFCDLKRIVDEAFENDVAVKISSATRSQVVLANNVIHAKAGELLARLDEQQERENIASLEEVIARREQQGDYWPEGRLNLGIAYACLGEYQAARRWLEDAVNMLRYPSYVPRSEQMAA